MAPPVGFLAAGAALLDTVGKVGEINAQERASVRTSEYNQQRAMQNADQTRERTAQDLVTLDQQGRRSIGEATAGFGASGPDFGTTMMAVLADSASQIQRDRIAISLDGERRAAAFGQEAALDAERINSTRRVARRSRTASVLSGLFGAGREYFEREG